MASEVLVVPSSEQLNLFAVMATAFMYKPLKDMVNELFQHYRKKDLLVEPDINVFVFLVMYLIINSVYRWIFF